MANQSSTSQARQPGGGLRFDWAAALLGFAWLIGVFADGWAHQHGQAEETFLTPWHALFYGGWLALATFLVVAAVRNHRRGFVWRYALPTGYGLSLVGVSLLAIAGGGDFVWHEIFGLETNPEVLFSPTHLLLGFAFTLSVSGPLRAAFRRPYSDTPRWRALFPMLLAATAMLSEMTFMMQWASPIVEPYATAKVLARHPVADPFAAVSIGVAGIMLHTGILLGVALLLVRRWRLPVGSFTLMLTLNAIGMGLLHDEFLLIPLGVVGGLVADSLLWRLNPSLERRAAFRWFSFLLPATYYVLYFGILVLTEDVVWSVPQWAGAIALAGIVGWLLSYAFVPPRGPDEQRTS